MKQISISNGTSTFTFDNSLSGATINQYEGFEYADVIEVIDTLPQRSGGIFIESDFGTRRISWSGDLLGSSRFSQRRDLMSVLNQGSTLTVQFTTYDDIDLQVQANLRSIKLPYTNGRQKYMIEMTCPDHRFESQTLKTSSTQVTNIIAGTALPTALPLSFEIVSGTTALELTNSGNEEATPTFTVRGPGNNFIVRNLTTAQRFNVDVTLTTNETITVDVENRTVVQGNNQNQYGSFNGDWWGIAPGTNEIFFDVDSGSDANTQLTVEYRDSYRGV